MKISLDKDSVIVEEAYNAPQIEQKYIDTANKILNIIKNKEDPIGYIQKKALEKLATLKKLDIPKEEKIKRTFDYIHWYYTGIASFIEDDRIKISIPDQFRELSENPQRAGDLEIIICGDNPGNTEYEDDRGFNPEKGSAGKLLNKLLSPNIDEIEKKFYSLIKLL